MSSLETVFECPICFSHYADVEPTTLPCGHSCCLTDAKAINQCHICRVPISKVVALVPNYTLRDAAVIARGKSNEEIAFKGPSDSVSAVTAAPESNLATSEKKKKRKKKKKKAATKVPGVVADDAHLEDEGSSDEEAEEDKSAPVNPSMLSDYTIRTLTDSSLPMSNIERIFRQSLTVGEVFSSFTETATVAPWKHVLIHMANTYAEEDLAARYILQDQIEGTQLIVIDVLAVK
eukprot:gene24885-30065_t